MGRRLCAIALVLGLAGLAWAQPAPPSLRRETNGLHYFPDAIRVGSIDCTALYSPAEPGDETYCVNCTRANPTACGGPGAWVRFEDGQWNGGPLSGSSVDDFTVTDDLAVSDLQVTTRVTPGAGFQQVTVGTTSVDPGGELETVTWPTPFANTGYMAVCMMEVGTSAKSFYVGHLITKSAASMTVWVENDTGAGVVGVIHCIGVKN